MKRKILMALFALGTVGGYASGCAGAHCKAGGRRAAFESKVADLCVAAAKRAEAKTGAD